MTVLTVIEIISGFKTIRKMTRYKAQQFHIEMLKHRTKKSLWTFGWTKDGNIWWNKQNREHFFLSIIKRSFKYFNLLRVNLFASNWIALLTHKSAETQYFVSRWVAIDTVKVQVIPARNDFSLNKCEDQKREKDLPKTVYELLYYDIA